MEAQPYTTRLIDIVTLGVPGPREARRGGYGGLVLGTIYASPAEADPKREAVSERGQAQVHLSAATGRSRRGCGSAQP
jgi:hypothetical protein